MKIECTHVAPVYICHTTRYPLLLLGDIKWETNETTACSRFVLFSVRAVTSPFRIIFNLLEHVQRWHSLSSMPLMRARNSNMRVIFRACANERHGNSEGNTPEKKNENRTPELILLHLLTINYSRRRMNQSRFNDEEKMSQQPRISINWCKRLLSFRSLGNFSYCILSSFRKYNWENEDGVAALDSSLILSCRLLNFIFACVCIYPTRAANMNEQQQINK